MSEQTTKPTRSPRAPMRRAVLEDLARIRRFAAEIKGRWDVAATVYDLTIRDEQGNGLNRGRRIDEYPEQRAEDWDALARYATAIERIARNLREVAEAEAADRRAGR